MWVAIDCRSKNWAPVLKSLGSTGLEYHRYVNPLGPPFPYLVLMVVKINMVKFSICSPVHSRIMNTFSWSVQKKRLKIYHMFRKGRKYNIFRRYKKNNPPELDSSQEHCQLCPPHGLLPWRGGRACASSMWRRQIKGSPRKRSWQRPAAK
jgi:hypothetical protein